MMRNLNNPLLLLVDDTPRDLVLLAGILGPAGYQLSLAANGHQALALAAKELPDLIIMDILMPDLGGLEVCRQLKADPATTGDLPDLPGRPRRDHPWLRGRRGGLCHQALPDP